VIGLGKDHEKKQMLSKKEQRKQEIIKRKMEIGFRRR